MIKIALALALCLVPTSLSAQTGTVRNGERIYEIALFYCPKFVSLSETEMRQSHDLALEAFELNPSEGIYLLNLCMMYAKGMSAGYAL